MNTPDTKERTRRRPSTRMLNVLTVLIGLVTLVAGIAWLVYTWVVHLESAVLRDTARAHRAGHRGRRVPQLLGPTGARRPRRSMRGDAYPVQSTLTPLAGTAAEGAAPRRRR